MADGPKKSTKTLQKLYRNTGRTGKWWKSM